MSTPKKAASGTAAVSSTPFLRVGESGIHGLGAFATRSLPASTFLGFYEGRRYTPAQIAAKDWDDQLTYLFTLSDGNTIDGGKGGNATRHLNHSCDPNCEAVEAYDDKGRMVLRFQTLRAVRSGEELFIDYSLTCDEGCGPEDFPCHCGAANCRGTMLAPPEQATMGE